MKNALIGYTGFVGGNLMHQRSFDALYNSKNIEDIVGKKFDKIICSGLPAAKWIANRDPAADRATVERLANLLKQTDAQNFILISTVDVYPVTRDANEDTDCHANPNHAYGTNRLWFEDFISDKFPGALIVRLPALFGPGLKKNIIYDLMNRRELSVINPESQFQWYDVGRLADDLDRAEKAKLRRVNFVTEPVATKEILTRFFPDTPVGDKAGPAAYYDLRTRHGEVFGRKDGYMIGAAAVLDDLGRYVAGGNTNP